MPLALDITKEYTIAEKKASNESEESYNQAAEAVKKERAEIEKLTEAQIKQKALLSKNNKNIEYDFELNYVNIDDNLSDIQKYSNALEELKHKQEEYLADAVMWQNYYADDKNYGDEISATDDYQRMMNALNNYNEVVNETEYIQEKLNLKQKRKTL